MDFDRLLDEVTALVNERGRVSLAALTQYFDLNDAQLVAVREELVDARASVSLENDRILVALDAKPAAAVSAERRNLTVMFVDMVGSTDLAARLDPEDLRDVVRRYQETVASATERLHGYTAQYLGDGVLIYFGFPHAHGDDPKRAVYAAHEILSALPELNAQLEKQYRIEVALRIGVHTGLVVVGDVGAGARHEALALGKTPNVAARLESIAAPGTVLLSEQTRSLLGDQFELLDLGQRELKGIEEPARVFQSLRPSGVMSAFDLAVKHKLLPMAGRKSELDLLTGGWAAAREGNGGSFEITGDAGIGKSRLIQALKDQLSANDERWTALRASPYDTNTPLYPVVALLRQTIGIDDRDSARTNFERISITLENFPGAGRRAMSLIAQLCGVAIDDDEHASALDLRAASELFAHLFMQFLLEGPRLLVVEDVHWLDPTTIALTHQLIERAPDHSMLVIISARSGFDTGELSCGATRRLRLGPLPRADVAQMIESVAGGRTLDVPVVDEIVRRTDGVPAFVEELTRMLLSSDWLIEQDDQIVANGPAPDHIPETLKDSLMARLDRLGDAKSVAQQAAVLGRTFSSELLAAVSGTERVVLDTALASLQDAQIIRKRSRMGVTEWRFRHALLQEAAYQSLLRATRQALHLVTARTIEAEFQMLASQRPERVARHFTLGGDSERALGYWQWAGEQAVENAAMREALAHVEAGMALLDELPASPLRDQRELALLSIKGSARVLIGGWAAEGLADIYQRALALVGRGGAQEHVDFQVLGGLCAFHLVRGEIDTVTLLAERLLRQGAAAHDSSSMTIAHVCLCAAGFFRGQFDDAREHAAQVAQHHDPDAPVPVSFLYGQDPAVITDSMIALMTWAQGDALSAIAISERAIATALRIKAPFSSLWANAWHARLLLECGQPTAALTLAEHTAGECARIGYSYVGALANLVAGVAALRCSDDSDGLARAHTGLQALNQSPNAMAKTYFNALIAEAEMRNGNRAPARPLIDDALAYTGVQGERFWRSELQRLDGVLLAPEDVDAATKALMTSVEQARELGAYRLLLRTANTLYEISADESPARDHAVSVLSEALERVHSADDDPELVMARERARRGANSQGGSV
ncbi:MAG: adenylate/guanylate cyclase domain-containing protein [Gammaproteobacteria bacterium]